MSSDAEITREVVARMSGATDSRLAEVLSIVTRHLHDAVREARVTEAEWAGAIDFLTRTGQMCDEDRQEFILLSDVLGVSMLVDSLNHEAGPGVTASTVFGPFYSGRQPTLPIGASILKRSEAGTALAVSGRVNSADGEPIAGALVEVWQTASNGLYDIQDAEQPRGNLRASFDTDRLGRYSFRTVLPVSYPIPGDGPVGQLLEATNRHPFRPAHIHFMISAPGHQTLVTHLFIDGDPYLDSDAVLGVKSSLIVVPVSDEAGDLSVCYDFGLLPERRDRASDG